jgi:hypothetical protein
MSIAIICSVSMKLPLYMELILSVIIEVIDYFWALCAMKNTPWTLIPVAFLLLLYVMIEVIDYFWVLFAMKNAPKAFILVAVALLALCFSRFYL